MNELKKDMLRIQYLTTETFSSANSLVSLAGGSAVNMTRLQELLEQTSAQFERAVLELRTLCERHSPGVGGYGQRLTAPSVEAAGYAERVGFNWLHIQLNTLLPHCRYQSPAWLSDTISRLLDDCERRGDALPFFHGKALLVIDEHSRITGRRIFDQDNKGWRAVCNALKGRVIPDDDQYTLGVALLSTESDENLCHITLMDFQEASDFFAFHSGDYALNSFYGGR